MFVFVVVAVFAPLSPLYLFSFFIFSFCIRLFVCVFVCVFVYLLVCV